MLNTKVNLLRLKFSNFLSFKDEQEILFTPDTKYSKSAENNIRMSDDISVLPVTAVYGANASGKSNLLSVLNNLGNLLKKTIDSNEQQYYRPFATNDGEDSLIEVEFVSNTRRYELSVVYSADEIKQERLSCYVGDKSSILYSKTGVKILPAKNSNLENYDIAYVNDFLSKRNDILILGILDNRKLPVYSDAYQGLLAIASNLKINFKLGGSKADWDRQGEIAKRLHDDEELKKEIIDFVKYADFGIKDITIFPVSQVDKNELYALLLHHEGFGKLPFLYIQESDGTKQFLSYILAFAPAFLRGGIFVVDELDCNLHPLLLSKIIQMFNTPAVNRAGAQLIFSTHNTSVLRPGILSRDEVWFVNKNKQGVSEVYPLTDFTDIRENTNIEKWYYEGRLGSIPYFEELEILSELFISRKDSKDVKP